LRNKQKARLFVKKPFSQFILGVSVNLIRAQLEKFNFVLRENGFWGKNLEVSSCKLKISSRLNPVPDLFTSKIRLAESSPDFI
jgi:hypothetical protein